MALVAICTPHAGSVRPDHTRSVMEMQGATPQHQFIHVEVDMMIVGKARNMCLETAIPNKAEVAWFIDDDVVIPPNAGVLIDQALALGIVSGVYYSRRQPYTPQIYNLAQEPEYKGLYWPLAEATPKTMFKADAVGAGCLAINMVVLNQMKERIADQLATTAAKIEVPWIASLVKGLSPWFEFLDKKGEDLYFCERARDQEFEIWVNPDVQCLHIGEIPVGQAQWQYLLDNNLIRKEETIR